MEENTFLRQVFVLSPLLTELETTNLEEGLRSEVMPGQIAVTLNGSPRSAWSITPECTSDRKNLLFTLAVGKFKDPSNYHWKLLRTVSVLSLESQPGVLIATLHSNDSIAKLFVRLRDDHPFDVDYIIGKAIHLPEPWKTSLHSVLGPLFGMEQGSYDIAVYWARLTKTVDRYAAGISNLLEKRSRDREVGIDSMGPKKGSDPKMTRQATRVEERRSRGVPQTTTPSPAVPERRSMGNMRNTTVSPRRTLLISPSESPRALPMTPGSSSKGTPARKKQKASQTIPPAPALIPESSVLLSQPGLDLDTGDSAIVATEGSTMEPVICSAEDVGQGGSDQALAEGTVVRTLNLPGRQDDIRNIVRPRAMPTPARVYLKSENAWSSNPCVRTVDSSTVIPEELETEILSTPAKKNENRTAELRARSLLNDKFARESEYMYIFGRDQIFELALLHMEPSDHRSGMIYRDFEKKGAEDVQRELLNVAAVKQVLTVLPNLDRRPLDWVDCVNAGKFKIINGQHTWHAAMGLLNDPVLREESPKVQSLKTWDVQVVWTDKVHHLHALSFKCNEGHNETKHLTSTPKAIIHCRVLWDQAGRPPLVRKNASSRRKKDAGSNDETMDPLVKSKFEAFRVRACQSLSATIKQEHADKPVRIDWDKRGERHIFMSPDHVWKRWEEVFNKFEAGELIDLDTNEEIWKSKNAKDLMNFSHITGTVLRGLNTVTSEQLGEVADHILKNPPRVFIGKSPKQWTRALPLEKWCERRKWKNALVKAIGERIDYFQGSKKKNPFVDDNGDFKMDVWRPWKEQRLFSSTIMQCIYFSKGTEQFVSDTIAVNKKSPKYPPVATRYTIDQALVNNKRAEGLSSSSWSIFVPFKPSAARFSNTTAAFGNNGELVVESRRFNPKRLTAGIIDLRHFPLLSKESEISTSWNGLLRMLQVRSINFGYQSVAAWMIIAPREKRGVVSILQTHFFPNHEVKHVRYTYMGGEPMYKARQSEVDEITYLETRTTLNNGDEVLFSDDIDHEQLFEKKFEKQDFYRAEQKGVVYQNELRMETYLRFLARHTDMESNIILAFAGAKAIKACRMMQRNSISFEVMRATTERLLLQAVKEGPGLWRTYFIPNPAHMHGPLVEKFNVLSIAPLVNYRIHTDVPIGEFYSGESSTAERLTEESIGDGFAVPNDGSGENVGVTQDADVGLGTDSSATEYGLGSEDDVISLESGSQGNDIVDLDASTEGFSDHIEDCTSLHATGDIPTRSPLDVVKGKETMDTPTSSVGVREDVLDEMVDCVPGRALGNDSRRRRRRKITKERVQIHDCSPQLPSPPAQADFLEATDTVSAPELTVILDMPVVDVTVDEAAEDFQDAAECTQKSMDIHGVLEEGAEDRTLRSLVECTQDEQDEQVQQHGPEGQVDLTEAIRKGLEGVQQATSERLTLETTVRLAEEVNQKAEEDVEVTTEEVEEERRQVPGQDATAPLLSAALQGAGEEGREFPEPERREGRLEEAIDAVVQEAKKGTENDLLDSLQVTMMDRLAMAMQLEEERNRLAQEARDAENAWREVEAKGKEAQNFSRHVKEKQMGILAREEEEFVKKYAKPAPSRVLLADDDESDEEDQIRRARLLRKFNCIVPASGTHAVNRFGVIHEKPNPEGFIKPELQGEVVPASGLPRTSEGPGSEIPLTASVKEEMLISEWSRKRKREVEEEVSLRVEKKLAKAKESMKEELLRDLASQIQAGRIPLPYSGGISSGAGMQSRIQSGLSNAMSPPPAHLDSSTMPVPNQHVLLVLDNVADDIIMFNVSNSVDIMVTGEAMVQTGQSSVHE